MSCLICLVCFILFSYLNHFPSYNAEPIRGGQYDRGNEVIWQVSFQWKRRSGGWSHVCGGSIISSEHIVSAAHCFVHIGNDNIKAWDQRKREITRILIGTNDLNSGGVELKIDKVIVPKGYTKLDDQTLLADIAVVKLTDRIDLSINREKYGGIGLFYPKNEIEKTKYDDQEGFAAGFGAVEVKVGLDGIIIYVLDGLRNMLPVHLTDYNCPKVYGLRCVQYVKNGEGPKGICRGDSGSPLYYRNGNEFELVGIISRGPPDCDIRQSNKKVGKIMFIPDYKDFLYEAGILNENATFSKMTIEDFKKSEVNYIVLPDQAEFAQKYYATTPIEREEKKPCYR